MRYFDLRLNQILEFTDPDRWYGDPQAITFMFDGNLYTAPGNMAHLGMIKRNPDIVPKQLARKYGMEHPDDRLKIRMDIEDYMLLGRVGYTYDNDYVSYWNDKPKLYNQFLAGSLKALMDEDIVLSDAIVSTPIHDDKRIYNVLKGEEPELPPEELEKKQRQADLMRRLHLMGPDEKKKAREELGLVAKGKVPMSQRAGLVPGQKYWAMSSEGRE